jgi:hypothetical protein
MASFPLEQETHEELSLWNMAQATLMRLDQLIQRIQEASLGVIVTNEGVKVCKTASDLGDLQLIKYRLIKQFLFQSIPLFLKAEQVERIQKIFDNIKKPVAGKSVYEDGTDAGIRSIAQVDIDDDMDHLFVEIQKELQACGYFMPKSEDPRHLMKMKG